MLGTEEPAVLVALWLCFCIGILAFIAMTLLMDWIGPKIHRLIINRSLAKAKKLGLDDEQLAEFRRSLEKDG